MQTWFRGLAGASTTFIQASRSVDDPPRCVQAWPTWAFGTVPQRDSHPAEGVWRTKRRNHVWRHCTPFVVSESGGTREDLPDGRHVHGGFTRNTLKAFLAARARTTKTPIPLECDSARRNQTATRRPAARSPPGSCPTGEPSNLSRRLRPTGEAQRYRAGDATTSNSVSPLTVFL